MVMLKLIIQKKITTIKCSVCLVTVLVLFLWCPVLLLVFDILGFVGNGTAPLIGQLAVEMAGGFFLFFLLSLVVWAVHCKWEP
jgi:hypothetical protein